MSPTVTLREGPFDGVQADLSDSRASVICTGDPVPEGMVARYGPTREKGVFRFRGYDKIVATLPQPGKPQAKKPYPGKAMT